jgi:predicted PurR-regulated permease PerM
MPLPPPTKRRALTAAMPGSALATLQVSAIVVAALYVAREMLIPIVLAVLLSFVLAPLVRALRRVRVPRIAAVLLVVVLGFAVIIGLGLVVGRQATSLAANIPAYKATVTDKMEGLRGPGGLLERLNKLANAFGTSGAPEAAAPAEGPPGDAPKAEAPALGAAEPASRPVPVEIRTPDPTAFGMMQRLAEPLLGPLATFGIVVVLVIFILLYREDLRDRAIRLAGAHDVHRTLAAMDDAALRLSRYFLAQVGLNAGFGVCIAAGLWAIGIPNPALWGALAGVLRFVPFFGAYIAAAFPMVLGLAVDPGWTSAIWVVALFAIGEPVMGQVLEPWLVGQSTGLSPVAVIGAAAFWTWLWGPVGLLLAVPLTVCLVVLGRHVEQLEFLEVMLGDQPPLEPEEMFYQRALAGDVDALAEQAETCLGSQRLPRYLDGVAMPALALAQADAARGTLTPERRERMEQSVVALLEDVEEADEATAAKSAGKAAAAAAKSGEDTAPEPESRDAAVAALVPAAWREPGAVLCLPGRGAFDPLLATMVGQALARRGFGAQVGGGSTTGGVAPRLLCLCFVEGGASAATARYLLRRARRRHPGVPAMALAWSPEPDGPVAEAMRGEPGPAPVLVSCSVADAVDVASDAAGGGTTSAAMAAPAPQGGAADPGERPAELQDADAGVAGAAPAAA